MRTARYDEVFSIPVAREPRGRAGPDRATANDLEFSEYGRAEGIPPGWYLVPGLLITATLVALL